MYVSIQEFAGTMLRAAGSFEGSGLQAEQSAWTRHGAHFARLGTAEAL